MQNFVRRLLTEWRRLELAFDDQTIIVAVSGGADSTSLTLGLRELRRRKKLDLRIVIAHFNHKLRGADSDADEDFVKHLAGECGFELALGSGKIAGEKGNLEQNARNARYRFLAETAENASADAILTAHTMNDQAETFLFNLMRGSGLEGLGGIKPSSAVKFKESETRNPPSAIRLIRPLLNWAKREDAENFCRLNEIEFRYDSMNEDLKFNRVRIRKVLLPLLKDFNPKIVETLAQTAKLLSEDAAALCAATAAQQTQIGRTRTENSRRKSVESLTENEDEAEFLFIKDLTDIFPSVRRGILRDWLKTRRGDLRRLDAKHLEAIEKLILSRKSGRTAELTDGETVYKKDGKLFFQKAKVEK